MFRLKINKIILIIHSFAKLQLYSLRLGKNIHVLMIYINTCHIKYVFK